MLINLVKSNRGADAAIVVYDVTKLETFERAQRWVQELQETNDVAITLVGTKADLISEKKVYGEAGKEFAMKKKVNFIETSAKTNLNVVRLFNEVSIGIADTFKLKNSLTIILAENERILNCC